jgi:GH15 family glucan-1,4-alpha-glucosidase
VEPVTERLISSPHSGASTLGGSPVPPIAGYAFLSGCEVSALIAASGNVEWMCLPRMDSPGVFAAQCGSDVLIRARRVTRPGGRP